MQGNGSIDFRGITPIWFYDAIETRRCRRIAATLGEREYLNNHGPPRQGKRQNIPDPQARAGLRHPATINACMPVTHQAGTGLTRTLEPRVPDPSIEAHRLGGVGWRTRVEPGVRGRRRIRLAA